MLLTLFRRLFRLGPRGEPEVDRIYVRGVEHVARVFSSARPVSAHTWRLHAASFSSVVRLAVFTELE